MMPGNKFPINELRDRKLLEVDRVERTWIARDKISDAKNSIRLAVFRARLAWYYILKGVTP